VEKYYLAVARTFRADARVFQPKGKRGSAKSAAFRQMLSTIFDKTAAELASLFDLGGDDAMRAIEEEQQAIVSFLEIRASKAQLESIRGKLHEIQSLAAAEGAAEGDDDAEEERYRLTLAYYPLHSAKRGPRRKS